MSVSVVVGGQYGSEGKGKVAHYLARERRAVAAVRVGGPNSGHTAIDAAGQSEVLRQLPTAALLPDVLCVLAPGSYVAPTVLLDELRRTGLDHSRLLVDPLAFVVTDADVAAETGSDIGERIGSTCSGMGAAVRRRVRRETRRHLAGACPELRPFLTDTLPILRQLVSDGQRIVVEGTQGYGLSLLHAAEWPMATSRDTTAAAAVAEAGLSPLDVDEIALVTRAFPIRVAGNSGSFGAEEIDWATVASEAGLAGQLEERTSVTGRVRRVARFDPALVRRAIAANRPTLLVLNHLDYIHGAARTRGVTEEVSAFVDRVQLGIGRRVDLLGVSPASLIEAAPPRALAAA